ncbi:response regulator [Geothrix sp. 21YS21S-4]|uniref:response regulator n=1 Tax=Geothrix sp. 21YS21S-4 TaxID=3068889 RepID=UPI0027BAA126|nr:response regulator [Geothrix sp. 21YS21S-4]
MPRLLLVDDNPSIHRIAESLLAPTDVELVCVDSGAEALSRLEKGDRFDVILVDTAMPGMDGWTLLDRLRGMESTARLPIAVMAGVLDPVDPAKLAKAPIQGFLKKPIELRELGDRVKALLVTPVPAPPSAPAEASPFSTLPPTAVHDLLPASEAPDSKPAAPEEDLLLLTADDLWPEETAAEVPAPDVPTAEIPLELEELDLESLQDLVPDEDVPTPAPGEPPPATPEEDAAFLPDLDALDALSSELELPPLPEVESEADEIPSSSAEMAAAALLAQGAPAPPAVEEPAPAPPESVPHSDPAPAAAGQSPAAPGQEAVSAEQARALVQALVADPVLVDALVKAVVARMGDQVVREIAWEVMPDLAGRLQR